MKNGEIEVILLITFWIGILVVNQFPIKNTPDNVWVLSAISLVWAFGIPFLIKK